MNTTRPTKTLAHSILLCLLLLAALALIAQQSADPLQLQKDGIAKVDHWLDYVRRTGDARSTLSELAAAHAELKASFDMFEQGDPLAAHAEYCEALEIFASLGHRRGVARALEGSACLALVQGQAARALKLAAAAAHLRRLISACLTPAEQSQLDQKLLPAWEALSDLEGKDAWAAGSAMSLEEAIQYSLEEPESAISA